jgi:methyl-galactoside transport system substrate-binding protein
LPKKDDNNVIKRESEEIKLRILKRVLVLLECAIIMFTLISEYNIGKVNAQASGLRQKPVAVGVVLYNFEDKFISLVRQGLEDIQKQNEGKVIFKFFDGKGNQAIQNEVIDKIIIDGGVDILLVNLVNTQATEQVIDLVKSKSIPVVFFNREPVAIEPIKSYKKSYYVGTNAIEAGALQGQILINLWNNDRKSIDKNNDGILQYIMLQGERSSIEAQERTQYSISTINKAGIKTEQLALSVSNWRRDYAKESINQLFLQYDNRIEAIISNNDEMAIGAIEALQSHGYNKGDKAKTILVVGVDATLEAQELIKNGYMAGSVIQDPSEMAKAIYTVGLNIFLGNEPLYGTQYKSDETGVALRLPYKKYIS